MSSSSYGGVQQQRNLSVDAPTLEKLLQDLVAEAGIKVNQVIHVLRLAVTGKPVGFGMFDTLAILGRERCLRRIDMALARKE